MMDLGQAADPVNTLLEHTTPMPMYTCASMWQWNSHTPALSATNLTAVVHQIQRVIQRVQASDEAQ
jgi:hypothetical protein